jgi:hypothetical protein
VAGLALIIGLAWFFIARHKKQMAKTSEAEVVAQKPQPMPELPAGARDGRSELGSETYMYAELPAVHRQEISELDSERSR